MNKQCLYATKTAIKLFCKYNKMRNSTHTKEHKQDRMMLGREHMWQCDEKGKEGEGRQRAGREDWVRVHLVRVFLKTVASASYRATGSMTKACTQQGQTAGGVLPRSLSRGGSDTFHSPLFLLLVGSIVFTWTPPIQSNCIFISISHPVISYTMINDTAAISRSLDATVFVTISILFLTCLAPDFPPWECCWVRGAPRGSALLLALQATHHHRRTGSEALNDWLKGLDDLKRERENKWGVI